MGKNIRKQTVGGKKIKFKKGMTGSNLSSKSITSPGDLVELQTPDGIKMVTQSKYDAEMREGKGIIASPRHFSSNDIIMDNYTDASGNAVVSQKEGGGYNDLRSLDWIKEIKKDGKPKTQVTD